MMQAALVFFLIALIAAIFGFLGIAVNVAHVAKLLCFASLALAVVSLVVGRRAPL
jgi:uncharacterized membrane protein YtjA (UPF0391 family)